eukprot:gene8237-826_t
MESYTTIKDICVMGNTLRCYITTGHGPEVLLLHESFSSSSQFQAQLTGTLGRQLRLIAIDLPGHGASFRSTDSNKHYTVSGMASIVASCLQELGIRTAFVVGSGLGGRIALKLLKKVEGLTSAIFSSQEIDSKPLTVQTPEIIQLSQKETLDPEDIEMLFSHFVPKSERDSAKWLREAIERADGKHFSTIRHELETQHFDDFEELADLPMHVKVGIIVGAKDELVSSDYLFSIELDHLWRRTIQLVPGATHLVAPVMPLAFDTLLRDIIRDKCGSLTLNPKEPLKTSMRPSSHQTTGQDNATDKIINTTSKSANYNPYARGKIPPGTLPHPSMRFELVDTEDQPTRSTSASTSTCSSEIIHAEVNPYARGRNRGGYLPHPNVRFEGAVAEQQQATSPQKATTQTNPYARGRIPGGELPHPSMRFEGTGELDNRVGQHVNTSAPANPYARGRLPGGVLPHRGMRFEGHWIDRPNGGSAYTGNPTRY